MKVTNRQLRRIIKEEKKRKLREVYPIGGEDGSANLEWQTFRDAAYDVAAGFIDAGMEADGIEGAMHDEISSIINEMETTWDDAKDEGFKNEGTSPDDMPYAWRQLLGDCLKGKK